MTDAEFWGLIIQGIGAFFTLFVAILAIWGHFFRSWLAGPKLEICLHDPQGEVNYLQDGTPARYYHLKVANKRRGAQAKNVRVVLTKILKPAADGTWANQALSGPLQLTWQFPHSHPQYPTIGPDDFCDIGNLIKGKMFILTPYVRPNNFVGFIGPNQRMQIEVMAIADNAESNSLCVEIAWDGNWSDDTLQMQRYLVVKEASGRRRC